jgi:hypothetical protein
MSDIGNLWSRVRIQEEIARLEVSKAETLQSSFLNKVGSSIADNLGSIDGFHAVSSPQSILVEHDLITGMRFSIGVRDEWIVLTALDFPFQRHIFIDGDCVSTASEAIREFVTATNCTRRGFACIAG